MCHYLSLHFGAVACCLTVSLKAVQNIAVQSLLYNVAEGNDVLPSFAVADGLGQLSGRQSRSKKDPSSSHYSIFPLTSFVCGSPSIRRLLTRFAASGLGRSLLLYIEDMMDVSEATFRSQGTTSACAHGWQLRQWRSLVLSV